MRFRKSVKICPGVKLNVSKSGISTNVGVKGASLSFGKKGVYANYGIPGTGLYDRQKIGGSTSSGNSGYNRELNYGAGASDGYPNARAALISGGSISVEYLEDGTIKLYDDGVEIIDKALISAIKRDPGFKRDLAATSERRIEEYKQQTAEFTEIQKKARKVYPNVEALSSSIKCRKYEIKSFDEVLPSDDELRNLAAREIGKKLFGNKKRFDEYVMNYKADYEQRRIAYERNEARKKEEMDQTYMEEYEKMQNMLRSLANLDIEATEKRIEGWLASIEFPFEFNVQYDIQDDCILVDLDLPEIEDIPAKTTQTMASGVVKVKDKSKKEIKQNYSDCVFGLAIYFASGFFNTAMAYNNVILSAYTQRRNSKGIINDDYILSVKFDREGFCKLNYQEPAIRNCMKFENICLQNADLNFKKIEPFS